MDFCLVISKNHVLNTNNYKLLFWQLALLLHQELNSSTRVPRVPRIRYTGILPQLSSPTATSMLAKCTYSSGGKDHISVNMLFLLRSTCKRLEIKCIPLVMAASD